MPLSIGALALGSSIALTALRGVPLPGVADEFSYLLAADTFARGRLTNRPHPFWQHFESPHILQQPTYASKYPPGQGLVLALGQGLTGHPIVGVWISTALACAAVAWALLGWLPPRWALLGSLIVAFHPVVLGMWGQSYWGGAVALCGGALVTGAMPRILAIARMRDAVWMAVGAAILAISRPFEGAMLTAAAGIALLAGLRRRQDLGFAVVMRRVVVPAACVLAAVGAWIAYYDYRVTGDPLLMPHSLHHATYEVAPLFVWEKPGPEPAYRHARLREEFLGWALMRSDMARVPLLDSRVYDFDRSSMREFLVSACRRAQILLLFSGHPQLVVVWLLAAPFAAASDRRFRRALFILVGAGCALMVTSFLSPHYAAPLVAIGVVSAVQALRHLRLWRWRRRPVGKWITALCIAAWALTTPLWLLALTRPPPPGFERDRASLIHRLARGAQRNLLIVRYETSAGFDREWANKPEWVYNGADIDAQPVVFARAMDGGADRALVEYFRDRRAWLFEPEADPPRLTPYPSR